MSFFEHTDDRYSNLIVAPGGERHATMIQQAAAATGVGAFVVNTDRYPEAWVRAYMSRHYLTNPNDLLYFKWDDHETRARAALAGGALMIHLVAETDLGGHVDEKLMHYQMFLDNLYTAMDRSGEPVAQYF